MFVFASENERLAIFLEYKWHLTLVSIARTYVTAYIRALQVQLCMCVETESEKDDSVRSTDKERSCVLLLCIFHSIASNKYIQTYYVQIFSKTKHYRVRFISAWPHFLSSISSDFKNRNAQILPVTSICFAISGKSFETNRSNEKKT